MAKDPGPAVRLRRIETPLLLAFALFGLSCVVETDRDRYGVGDAGAATFHNLMRSTAYLSGCSVFAYEQLAGGTWRDRGPGVVCVWEGFARPVEPGDSLRFAFRAPDEPGVWRLRVAVGRGCSPTLPLGACGRITDVASEPFEVVELCEARACGPPLGMPNVLCSDGESVGGPTDRCLRDLETNLCAWEIVACPEERASGG